MTKNECFIIMPISTPESMTDIYLGDKDHFEHVMEHLFIPAIEKAELQPVLPVAKGADLIHAEIIKNLELAELVLCDITNFNPNVFFELGYRTALNKPVCYVKDNYTIDIPFDQAIINHYTYNAELSLWEIDREVENLSYHITDSIKRSAGENKLWKYFGLKSIADPLKGEGDVKDIFDLLSSKIDSIMDRLEKNSDSVEIEDLKELEKKLKYRDKPTRLAMQYSKVENKRKQLEEELDSLVKNSEHNEKEKIEELKKRIEECVIEQTRLNNALNRAMVEFKK